VCSVTTRLRLTCGLCWCCAASGLPHYWDSESFLEAFRADRGRLWQGPEMIAYAAQMQDVRLKRGQYHYSDTNYVLLGLVVEEKTGESNSVFRSKLPPLMTLVSRQACLCIRSSGGHSSSRLVSHSNLPMARSSQD
jgi:hypothetical protein